MRRIVLLVVVALVMAAMMVMGNVSYAFAFAAPGSNGAQGQGQENALLNCADNTVKQENMGVSAGGGPKEGTLGPANCDHFHGVGN